MSMCHSKIERNINVFLWYPGDLFVWHNDIVRFAMLYCTLLTSTCLLYPRYASFYSNKLYLSKDLTCYYVYY